MNFQRYEKYKSSDIDWLGEIPEGWEAKRIASIYYEAYESGNDQLPFLSVSIHSGVSDKELDEEDLNRKVNRTEDAKKNKYVMPNDLVYNMMRAWQGGFGTVLVDGMISSAYVVARPINKVNSRFIEFLLRTPNAIIELWRNSKGIVDFRLRLYWNEFKNIHICLPNPKDQSIITAYLDQKITLIDQKIELLKAKKQKYLELKKTLISETVTRGLDKNVEMKDSCIEWIGKIPKHWEVKRLKDEFDLLSSGISYFQGNKEYLSTASIGINEIILTEEVITFSKRPSRANMQPKINTAWFAKMKATNKSYIFFNKEECSKYVLSTGFCAFDVNKSHIHFVKYYIISGYFIFEKDIHSYGTTQFSINDTNIGQLNFVKPPKSEQIAIANYLDEKTSKIDKIIQTIDKSILVLQEYRKTLINDVVTGKVKII